MKINKKNYYIYFINQLFLKIKIMFFVNHKKHLNDKFKSRIGRDINFDNPTLYNDKLQWLKLYWRDELAIKCANKYYVRDFIKENIGDKYLNNLYGVYDKPNDINFEILPSKFALKATHASGLNIICEDKAKLDIKKSISEMKRWLIVDYSIHNLEWVYKSKPKIICEEYLGDNQTDELKDYRFFCFNGKPKFISVDFSITNKKKTRRNLYDLNWKLIDAEITYPKETSYELEKPKKLNEMIELSRKLSKPFPHVRVDFYYLKDEIYFGELTFFHQSGMGPIRPLEFEKQMGDWLILPSKKEN
jgi:hypothetical protein